MKKPINGIKGREIVFGNGNTEAVFVGKVTDLDLLFIRMRRCLTDKDREGRRVRPRAFVRKQGDSVVIEICISEEKALALNQLLNQYFATYKGEVD